MTKTGKRRWFVGHKDPAGHYVAFWQPGGGWLGASYIGLSWIDPGEIALFQTKAEAQALAVGLAVSGTTFQEYANWAGEIGVYRWKD
jgi:hypothetical protein